MIIKLIQNSNKGVLIDRTPVMRDMRDTFEVSFLLPSTGDYMALFKDSRGFEYKVTIKDGVCKIPKELLGAEQYVEVAACRLEDGKIAESWECEPLLISAFFSVRKNQWQVSGGMTDKDCYAQLNELEERYAENIKAFADLKAAVEALGKRLEVLESKHIEEEII